MKKNKKFFESSFAKKVSNKNLLKILLDTKKYLQNNNNFSKKTNETEETELTLIRKNSNNELPKMFSPKNLTPFGINTNNNYLNRNTSGRQILNKLLFNSMSFDNFLKEIVDSRVYGKSQDVLPPILHEEKKNFTEFSNSIPLLQNENNNHEIYPKKPLITKRNKLNNNKKFLFYLETLDDIRVNHRLSLFNQDKYINEANKEIKYNISRDIIFREIILNESSYKELYHQNNKYIMNAKYYNKFIISKIKEFKKEIPTEENFHLSLEKEFLESNYNKPKLILNSLSISFKCRGKYFLFHIPFELLPIFYFKNMENLKFVLINIIRFDNDYEDIYIDLEELTHILTYSKQFELEEDALNNNEKKPKDKFLEKRKLLKSTKQLLRKDISNLTNNFTHSASKDIFFDKKIKLKQSFKKNKTIRIFNGVKASPHTSNDLHEEKIYKSHYNKFNFKWLTPKYEYEVEIKAPEAILQIGRTSLRAYIDIEYIFNFIETDFKDWDFYISQIIFSYKECLHYLNDFVSFKYLNKNSLKKSSSQPLLNNVDINNINMVNNKTNRNIFLNMEKALKISEKSKIYEFFYTDKDNSNYIKILHNFSVSSRCKSFKIKSKFLFDFNFAQMKILNNIRRIQGLNHFIKKLIYIDKISSNLRFGYDELNSMANGDYKLLENQNPNKDAYQTCLRMKEIYQDIINITITFPFVETIRYDNQNYQNCFESDYNTVIFNGFSLDILDKLCHSNFNEWPKILINIKI